MAVLHTYVDDLLAVLRAAATLNPIPDAAARLRDALADLLVHSDPVLAERVRAGRLARGGAGRLRGRCERAGRDARVSAGTRGRGRGDKGGVDGPPAAAGYTVRRWASIRPATACGSAGFVR